MQHIKKIPAGFMIIALILLIFTACSSNSDKKNQDVSGDTVSDATDTSGGGDNPSVAETTEAAPDLPPNQDFGGAEFTMLLSAWSDIDFDSEEITGEPLDDAIYNRNKKIEEKYNVKLKWYNPDEGQGDSVGNSYATYRKAVKSGDGTYDVFFGIQSASLEDTMNGYNVEYRDLPYIDLSKPWWDKGILDVCFGDKVYFAAGDITHSTLGYTTLLLFNKNLFTENGVPFPYDDVRSGAWTWDKFIGTIKNLSRDLNGDGKMSPKDDLYTIAGWQYELPYNFQTALGGNEIIKDKDGYPQINVFDQKNLDTIQDILDLFSDYGGFFNDKNYGDDRDMFMNHRLYFLDTRFFEINRYFRDMQDDFGMIPHPKADASAPYYTQLVNSNVVTTTTVPVTNSRLEMTSILLEDLAYEGWKEITPQYKEVLLKTKLTRDNESADMFDYIWGHRTYRYGLIVYNNVLMNIISKGNKAYVSAYEKLQSKADTEIEKTKKFFFS